MALFTAQSLIISALYLGVAHAETNSTSSNTTMVGWVPPAPRRSTWSIIWSCLSIFIVCSWKCVHLNIPTHEEIQGEWHTVQIGRCLPDISFWPKAPLRRKWRRKIIWMAFIALAPEFGVALAAKQYMDARRELKEFTKALPDEALVFGKNDDKKQGSNTSQCTEIYHGSRLLCPDGRCCCLQTPSSSVVSR